MGDFNKSFAIIEDEIELQATYVSVLKGLSFQTHSSIYLLVIFLECNQTILIFVSSCV